MPNLIYETLYMKIFLDEKNKFIEIVLSHPFAETDVLKEDLLAFLEIGKEYSFKRNLWNLVNFDIVIDPELQTWIDENINQGEIAWGVKKEAFVLQDDIIAELGVAQTMEDQTYGTHIETKMFGDYDQALAWLLAEKNT